MQKKRKQKMEETNSCMLQNWSGSKWETNILVTNTPQQLLLSLTGLFLLPLAPSSAPGPVTGRNVSSSSLEVSWSPPPQADRNGIITNYTVYYRVKGSDASPIKSVQTGSSANQINVTGLSIYTEYSISVSASTSAGEGPLSNAIPVRTGESSE